MRLNSGISPNLCGQTIGFTILTIVTLRGGLLMKKNEKTYLSIEEIISLPTLSGTNISDNGKNVAFVKKPANWKDNKYRNHVWIYEKEKGQCYPLTTGEIDSTYPLWSPDSRNIAYL